MGTIILIIVILAVVGYFIFKDKQTIVEEVKDNDPITKDNFILVKGVETYKLTKSDLIYSDVDGDEITHVRFSGEVDNIFIDVNLTEKYISGTEVTINFELYVNFNSQGDTYKIQYNVKSNNKWSK